LWFNPAVWWVGSRLLEERERACDEAVLRAGAPPQSYATGLLEACRICLGSPFAWTASATGSNLTQRVEAIMTGRREPKLTSTGRVLLTAAAVVAIAAPITVGALSTGANPRIQDEGLARVTRFDAIPLGASGQPIAHDSGWHDVARDDGSLAPRPPSPASDGRAAATAPQPQPDPQPAPASRDAVGADVQPPLKIGGQIGEPKKIRDMRPVYPEEAKANGIQGLVILQVLIDIDGRVVDAQILRGHPLLNEAAIDAVTQWEFTPTLLNGDPVQVQLTVTINFTLS
jgi:TonB family protein